MSEARGDWLYGNLPAALLETGLSDNLVFGNVLARGRLRPGAGFIEARRRTSSQATRRGLRPLGYSRLE